MYELKTPGVMPVTLAEAKAHMKVTSDEDDDLITALIEAVTQWAEAYTGRDSRENVWTLTIDEFEDRIELRRSPVASITSVKYIVSGSPVTISSSVYYLKKGHQWSEILLQEDQTWPTDLDEIEAGIEIEFKTEAPRHLGRMKAGMLQHIALLYENRGDCDADTAKSSGATLLYDQFRIARI
jgi:uncharacterized phiE125 gp8 family phage protein